MFYPPLPSRALSFKDLLQFSLRYARGSGLRIALAVVAIGLLSLVTPFVTKLLISSIIPRSELDQLVFCALALGLTALAVASVQVMQGLVMLRMEATIDWRLQSAMIDRLLRLPTAIFREFTAGELVDRAMGIDAARRALTGHALRGMIAGLFCIFSLGLMIYYSPKLALVAIALTFVRAAAIICTNLVRLYFESKHFNQQGKVSGFVLQLLTGVGKLRVSAATGPRARNLVEAVCDAKAVFRVVASGRQRPRRVRDGISDDRDADHLRLRVLFEQRPAHGLGTFFAFFSAFGQSMGVGRLLGRRCERGAHRDTAAAPVAAPHREPDGDFRRPQAAWRAVRVDRACARVLPVSCEWASGARQRLTEDHAGRICRDRGSVRQR